MELNGTNQVNKDKKTKKIIIGISIALIILLIVSIVLYCIINYLKQKLFKFNIDNKSVSNINNELFVFSSDKIYVSLKDIAPLIGYSFNQGGYKEYTEDIDKCYLENQNEICTFEKDSNIIYKIPAETLDYTNFEINEQIKSINNKLYITSEGLCTACNLKLYRDIEKNTISIYTLSYFVDYYTKNNVYSAVTTNFNNQKAILYGLMVIQNVENNKKNNNENEIFYGVYSINDKNKIVGEKYKEIEFIESTQEFIVKTPENKVGIITSEGETKVQPIYDSLKQIDKDLNLYLATNGRKQGVLEKNGKILIYLEYDQIGINLKDFPGNDIKNSYLLFNNLIPVMKNNKWGMYDKKGNLVVPLEYDGIGCVSKDSNNNSVVIIPNLKGIVLAKTYPLEERKTITLYGIINYLGKELVKPGLQSVYYTVSNGRKEYEMMDYASKEIFNVIDWVNENKDLEELNEEETKTTNDTNTIKD